MKEQLQLILDAEITSIIPNTGKIETANGDQYFIKTGRISNTFQNEANGLKELAKSKAFNTTEVVSVGSNYILTKYIDSRKPQGDFFKQFGKQFAQLHRYKASHFGFYENNYIGVNPQLNISSDNEKDNWIEFYFNKRLLYQYKLAEKNGYTTPSLQLGIKNLEEKIEKILKNSIEEASLLHGDLWSGNFICDSNNKTILIDPAVYYGHREADLAMTKVFGGFPQEFYEAYNTEYPLKEGWQYREGIYKLYHILNHLNIFGRSYLNEAEYLLKLYI